MRSNALRTLALAGVISLLAAMPASAHVTTDPAEAPADGYATINFQIPHGCEESPTTEVRIKIPPDVHSVTPAVSPLWNVQTKQGRKDPVELHGEQITRGVSELVYTAREPLPSDRLAILPVSLKFPAGRAGEPIYFPTIQTCASGETRWIQIPAAGESVDELENPAPAVTLTAPAGESGAKEDSERDADVQAAGAGADDAPTWLAIVALAVGALGVAVGLAGLSAARRARS